MDESWFIEYLSPGRQSWRLCMFPALPLEQALREMSARQRRYENYYRLRNEQTGELILGAIL